MSNHLTTQNNANPNPQAGRRPWGLLPSPVAQNQAFSCSVSTEFPHPEKPPSDSAVKCGQMLKSTFKSILRQQLTLNSPLFVAKSTEFGIRYGHQQAPAWDAN